MPAMFIAAVFGVLALAGVWGIRNNLISGTATSRGWTCTIDDNPIGFCLIVSTRAVIVAFACVEILHAFGLADDPLTHIKHALPFLP